MIAAGSVVIRESYRFRRTTSMIAVRGDCNASAPEWFGLAEVGDRVRRRSDERLAARFLAPGHEADREGLGAGARAPSGAAHQFAGHLFAHRDVIEVAERVLQLLERRHERLAPFLGAPAREKGGEKVGRVAHLLDCDAQLVPLPRLKLAHGAAPFLDLAATTGKLFGRLLSHRPIETPASRFLARVRPGAGLDPRDEVEEQIAIARRGCRYPGARKCLSAPASQVGLEGRHPAIALW